MGNAIATAGSKITQATIPSHIQREYYTQPSYDEFGYPYGGGWGYASPISATVNGTIERSSGTVYSGGKLVCVKDNSTKEDDTHDSISYPYRYVSGKHTGSTSGRVSAGSATVFIGGVAVARKGDSVTTHAGTSTTIQEGSTTVFVG